MHLLCLLANGCHRNNQCNQETLQAVVLSKVPSDFMGKKADRWSAQDLKKFVSWYTATFNITGAAGNEHEVCSLNMY